MVSGHRDVRRPAAVEQRGLPARLQQRRAQPDKARESKRHRDANAAVLRLPPARVPGAGLDDSRHSVPDEGERSAADGGASRGSRRFTEVVLATAEREHGLTRTTARTDTDKGKSLFGILRFLSVLVCECPC